MTTLMINDDINDDSNDNINDIIYDDFNDEFNDMRFSNTVLCSNNIIVVIFIILNDEINNNINDDINDNINDNFSDIINDIINDNINDIINDNNNDKGVPIYHESDLYKTDEQYCALQTYVCGDWSHNQYKAGENAQLKGRQGTNLLAEVIVLETQTC